MKTRFLGLLSAALFAAGILLGAASTAFAHSMPYEEATLILDDVVGGGLSELTPRKSTLADAKRAIVRADLAHDHQRDEFTADGFRFVTCTFHYCEKFVFRSIADAKSTYTEDKLAITSYDVFGGSARTLSGFHVGMEYADVTAKYGEASSMSKNRLPFVSYTYTFTSMDADLTFDVDREGIIRVIRFRSEI